MDLETLAAYAAERVNSDPMNRMDGPELTGTPFFAAPIFGIAAADDPLFREFTRPEVVSADLLLPDQWLPGAVRVVSYFLPFSESVRVSNRTAGDPSLLWLYGRIEGQRFILSLSEGLAEQLRAAGYRALVPAADPRFQAVKDPVQNRFDSNWSERHAAFAAGLGTFGLSRNIITRLGAAGRLGSIITDAPLPVTPREYSEPYEWCSRCGACAPRCPVQAIAPGEIKRQLPCFNWLNETGVRFAPRYGCGKCQVKVPCETKAPARGK